MPAPRTARRTAVALTALMTLGAALAAPSATAATPLAPGGGRYDPGVPTITQDFPDPDVLQVSGTYHAYATNGAGNNLQHATSPDLRTWTVQADIAPELGEWASATCSEGDTRGSTSCVWAPEVVVVPGTGPDPTFTLYYTARRTGTDRQCVGVSTSPTTEGPFVPAGPDPLLCPEQGAIDPRVFTDDDGSRYVLWKVDGNSVGQPTAIYVQGLSDDGLSLTGFPVELFRADQPWEEGIVEAPALIKRDGRYVLFYSGGRYASTGYATGYATAGSISGPYTKGAAPIMSTDLFGGQIVGPGGADVITFADGSTRIAFHGWNDAFTSRPMYVHGMVWSAGVPRVLGAP